jgi:hypothetical protein
VFIIECRECVTILKGTLVEGSIEASDKSILRVNEQIEQPGYEAPLDDFRTQASRGKAVKQSPGLV